MLSRSERVSGVWRVFPLYPVHSKNKFLRLFNSSNHIMRQSHRFRETGHRLTLVTWYSEEWYGSRHRLYLGTPVSDMTCDSLSSGNTYRSDLPTLLRAPVPFLLPSHNPPHTTYSFELTPLSLCFQWIQHLRSHITHQMLPWIKDFVDLQTSLSMESASGSSLSAMWQMRAQVSPVITMVHNGIGE